MRDWATAAIELAIDPATGTEGTRKGDVFDFVTPADGLIERYLRTQVAARFPGHSFLGEEEGGANGAQGWQWIVDPIDGTLNYSTGLAGATCSIALRRDDDLVVGAVADLTTRSTYRALAGSGQIVASRADGDTVCQPTTSPAGAARIFLEFGWEDLDPVMVGTIEELAGSRPRAIRMVGGAAYALLNIALHGGCFLGIGLRIWDVAAGIVIAREAGREVRLWNMGTMVHLVVGGADDLGELAPLVEHYGSRRVAPAN
ncbi:MAG: inositol monophosphatase family protein [Chloroflexota bacterium]|nr:inositol monophosphatase family protein [Chloroflexota bacterium]